MYDPELTHLGIFLIAGLASPVAIKVIQLILSPSIPRLKRANTTYECGEKPIGDARIRYNFQFFTFAIVFVIFDILSILFLIWAYSYKDNISTTYDLLLYSSPIVVFTGVLLMGLLFWFKKNVLVWE